ncbi:TonB-dependent receptor [Sphingomonas sp. DT-51]|uniref:TonB-dependent receptor n=1 Tax=Sphingomonas sp. DT-51 TaxID=3396165 RepID=UPI003F1C8017
MATSAELPQEGLADDILVTATRRETVASRVPASISVLSRDGMDERGIRSIADVARLTSGVRFNPANGSISVRGIEAGRGGAGTTGIYIDDTPIQLRGLGFNPDEAMPAIFDLDRVEVLRGPQGTLFGAGSQGGTVRFITPQPSLSTSSGYARAELNSIEHGGLGWELGAAASTPLVAEQLGLRLSLWHRRDGGYIDHVDTASNQIDDRDINAGDVTVSRVALLWAPLGSLRVSPSLLFQRRQTAAWNSYFAGLSRPDAGAFRSSSPEYRGGRDEYVLPSLNVRQEVSWGALVANLSYFNRRNLTGYDGTVYNLSYLQHRDIYPGPYDENAVYPFLLERGINPALPHFLSPSRVINRQRNVTAELRAQASPGGRLDWVAGVFYQRAKTRSFEAIEERDNQVFYRDVFGQSAEELFGYSNVGNDSYVKNVDADETQLAGFADVRYRVAERLTISAGARAAHTTFTFRSSEAGNFTAEPLLSRGRAAQTPVTPRLGVDYVLGRRGLLYANLATGFRAGGANAPVNPIACRVDLDSLGTDRAPMTYGADRVRTAEIGVKGSAFGEGLRFDVAAYQNRWNGIQQNVYLAGCGVQFIANLGRARTRGVDLQATVRPARGLLIDATIGVTEARFAETVSVGPLVTTVRAGDAIEGPPWTASLGSRYDFTIAARQHYVRLDLQRLARLRRATPERNPLNETSYVPGSSAPDAILNISARAGLRLGSTEISLFADNLLNRASRTSSAPVDAEARLVVASSVRPRVMGLTLMTQR